MRHFDPFAILSLMSGAWIAAITTVSCAVLAACVALYSRRPRGSRLTLDDVRYLPSGSDTQYSRLRAMLDGSPILDALDFVVSNKGDLPAFITGATLQVIDAATIKMPRLPKEGILAGMLPFTAEYEANLPAPDEAVGQTIGFTLSQFIAPSSTDRFILKFRPKAPRETAAYIYVGTIRLYQGRESKPLEVGRIMICDVDVIDKLPVLPGTRQELLDYVAYREQWEGAITIDHDARIDAYFDALTSLYNRVLNLCDCDCIKPPIVDKLRIYATSELEEMWRLKQEFGTPDALNEST